MKIHIFWKESTEQHKDYSFYNLIRKDFLHIKKVSKDLKGIKDY